MVVRVLADGASGDPTSIQVLVGDEWIITHHARSIPFLDERRETIRDDRPVGHLTPVQFLVSVLDWHVDSFFGAAEELEAEVDQLDDAALGSDRDMLARLVDMRGRIARVRRLMSPHREMFAELARPVFLPSVVLAGVMGMNFKVGIFDNPNLFWVVIGVMVAMAVATLGVARWRGWL